jgi:hypothetical protein
MAVATAVLVQLLEVLQLLIQVVAVAVAVLPYLAQHNKKVATAVAELQFLLTQHLMV